MIAMARASTIPARFASVYAPGVSPPDFHAVAEVYLDGTWHLVDPTGMASADSIARIGVGPDAAGVAFLSVFGQATFLNQTVSVTV
jgi:transglutaminase-like putative cysteine protease